MPYSSSGQKAKMYNYFGIIMFFIIGFILGVMTATLIWCKIAEIEYKQREEELAMYGKIIRGKKLS